MLVYRICARRFAKLDGQGAKRFGGRWDSAGHAVVYTSKNLSLAVLEMFVNVDLNLLPDDLVRLEIEIPDKATIQEYSPKTASQLASTRHFGDQWLEDKSSLALIVPSVVVPEERNVLINPLHKQMSMVKVKSIKHFTLDERLLRRSRA